MYSQKLSANNHSLHQIPCHLSHLNPHHPCLCHRDVLHQRNYRHFDQVAGAIVTKHHLLTSSSFLVVSAILADWQIDSLHKKTMKTVLKSLKGWNRCWDVEHAITAMRCCSTISVPAAVSEYWWSDRSHNHDTLLELPFVYVPAAISALLVIRHHNSPPWEFEMLFYHSYASAVFSALLVLRRHNSPPWDVLPLAFSALLMVCLMML